MYLPMQWKKLMTLTHGSPLTPLLCGVRRILGTEEYLTHQLPHGRGDPGPGILLF